MYFQKYYRNKYPFGIRLPNPHLLFHSLVQIYLKSEVTSLNLQEEVTKVDKGLEILEDIVNKDILEIKDSIEK